MEHTDRAELISRGDELARTHDADTLLDLLSRRLSLDGMWLLGRMIEKANEAAQDNGRTFPRAVFYAIALIGRLRIEGRNELADTLVSLLSGGSLQINPTLWLSSAHAFIAMGRQEAANARAQGLVERAEKTEANAWNYLRSELVQRLHVDGRDELANAISEACRAFERQGSSEPKAPAAPPAAITPKAPSPFVVARSKQREAAVREHPADVWAHAAVARLRAEGREIVAAAIMVLWAQTLAGPMINPSVIAAELCAELRARKREALADTLEDLLKGASIDRDPYEIMIEWLNELSHPMVNSVPIATALVAGLRHEGHATLAEKVGAQLR